MRPNTIPDLKVDATFRKVPKNAITFALWKIDEDHLEAVVRPQYGTFYDNCAYIIYACNLVGHYANHETIVSNILNLKLRTLFTNLCFYSDPGTES